MTKSDLLIPAAGKSSRFPGVRPKWMLTHPDGNLMITSSCKGLNFSHINDIYVTILREHVEKYDCENAIVESFEDIGISQRVRVLILEEPTTCQAETVHKTIEHFNLSGPIFIKDTDSYFITDITPENSVCVFDLGDMGHVHASNKSFVQCNDQMSIVNIVEKRVISSTFCVGGYSFENAKDFSSCYSSFGLEDEEIYVSHVIYKMILNNSQFSATPVKDFLDWGTIKDWNKYKSEFATIFVDIDGVLIFSSSQYLKPKWGETGVITNNVNKINELYNSEKVKIILTTSRKSSFTDTTENQLKALGIKYHQIIYDLWHAKRIIINDYAKTNPYRSCDAINISRNSDSLTSLLEDQF